MQGFSEIAIPLVCILFFLHVSFNVKMSVNMLAVQNYFKVETYII